MNITTDIIIKYLLVVILQSSFMGKSIASCIPVEVLGKGYINVHIAGENFTGGAYVQPDRSYCGELPNSLTVSWSHSARFFEQQLELEPRLPANFQNNPEKKIKVSVTDEGALEVSFRVKLSSISTKYLEKPETGEDKKQRKLDEGLWVAIQQENLSDVQRFVRNGANLKQPWMGKRKYAKNVLLSHVKSMNNAKIMEFLLAEGLEVKENLQDSYMAYTIRNNHPEMLDVFLKYGLDTNAYYKEPMKFEHGIPVWPMQYKDRLLHLAVKLNNYTAVKRLIEFGASTDFDIHSGEAFVEWTKRVATKEIHALINAAYNNVL